MEKILLLEEKFEQLQREKEELERLRQIIDKRREELIIQAVSLAKQNRATEKKKILINDSSSTGRGEGGNLQKKSKNKKKNEHCPRLWDWNQH